MSQRPKRSHRRPERHREADNTTVVPENVPDAVTENSLPVDDGEPAAEAEYIEPSLIFDKCRDISQATWGSLKGDEIFDAFKRAYLEIIKWKRNLFQVPSGSIGKSFVKELSKAIHQFSTGTSLEKVSLYMTLTICPLLLQKPARDSKTKDHIRYLEKRIKLWQDGDIESLVKEGKAIQKRMTKSALKQPDTMKVFSRLMLQGKVSVALRWITCNRGSVKDCTEDVVSLLQKKPPKAQPVEPNHMLYGPIYQVDSVIFESISSDVVTATAKHVHGSAGPSGADADDWRRFLCSKSFKNVSGELAENIAVMARKLATQSIDPVIIEPYVASRLIPLAKGESDVRPIGVGETLRRITAKCILNVIKPEILSATAPLQTCAGLPGGAEASIHAMRELFNRDDTHGILLVDAENAFNSLNRKLALHNVRVICPEFYCYLLNTYRVPAKLFLACRNGDFLLSEEGTTQGDTSAMAFYGTGISPLVYLKVDQTSAIWYADDSGSAGTIPGLYEWWRKVKQDGPQLGYFPKASKSWLIVKPHFLNEARELFPDVNITTEGRPYLGSFIGTETGKTDFVGQKVQDWCNEIELLTKAAEQEPQLAYVAFVQGLSKKWNYLMRTTPNIAQLLGKVEETIRDRFIPACTGRQVDVHYRDVYALPTRHGGLAISNPAQCAQIEYDNSKSATELLVKCILGQGHMDDISASKEMKSRISHTAAECQS